ncbi:MAG: FKBP-type peptidyl-prolyl cis-trans isomerase FkpA [Gallionellaceae bacterium]|nr:MAG: FKBP-type peptidyl-prolyl cis-trans isomerase FkpA [Gallionellaceae bacterium]
MKRIFSRRLALLLVAGIFSIAGCSDQPLIGGGGGETDTASGLVKTDILLGEGGVAAARRKVTVHYTGWLYDENAPENKGKKFDSSRDSGKPYSFQLGAGQVIKGWDVGVSGMKEGGRRTLTIPPGLGYGARGYSNMIPANATLIFDVEMLGVD